MAAQYLISKNIGNIFLQRKRNFNPKLLYSKTASKSSEHLCSKTNSKSHEHLCYKTNSKSHEQLCSKTSIKSKELFPLQVDFCRSLKKKRRRNRKSLKQIYDVQRQDIVCFRCWRKGHKANVCQARLPAPANSSTRNPRRLQHCPEGKERFFCTSKSRQTKLLHPQNSTCHGSSPLSDGTRNRNARSKGKRKLKDFSMSKSKYYSNFITCNLTNSEEVTSDWIFDSAASHHFCKDKSYFSKFNEVEDETMSIAIDGVDVPIEGKGTIILKISNRTIKLLNVMYSSQLKRNLISGPKFDMAGASFHGGKGAILIKNGNQFLFKAFLKNGLYRVNPKVIKNPGLRRIKFAAPVKITNKLELWHKRCAHVSPTALRETNRENCVRGLPDLKYDPYWSCDSCRRNKFKRVSFKPLGGIRSKAPLDLLYADVWGPTADTGRIEERYYLSVIDDFSRFVHLYPLTSKSEVSDIMKTHIARVERQLDRNVKALRTDNGSEFVNNDLSDFLKERGIVHELTNTYSPEQNGVAERYNLTVVNGAKTILHDSGMDRSFWPEAMSYFTYTWNRFCHGNLSKTPYELFWGKRPSVNHMRPFGVLTYLGIPRQLRTKLDAKAVPGYLVGYARKTKGYRIWTPHDDRIVESINVSFDENKYFNSSEHFSDSNDSSSCESGAVMGQPSKPSETSEVQLSAFLPSVEEQNFYFQPVPVIRTIPSTIKQTKARVVNWYRKAVPRPDGSRNDIYYTEEGQTKRLRSQRDIRDYCKRYNLDYNPNLFSFVGKNKYTGLVPGGVNAGASGSGTSAITDPTQGGTSAINTQTSIQQSNADVSGIGGSAIDSDATGDSSISNTNILTPEDILDSSHLETDSDTELATASLAKTS